LLMWHYILHKDYHIPIQQFCGKGLLFHSDESPRVRNDHPAEKRGRKDRNRAEPHIAGEPAL